MVDKRLLKVYTSTNKRLFRGISVSMLGTVLVFGGVTSMAAKAQSADEYQPYSKAIVIRPGDTLSHIALREMGNASHAEQLALANDVHIDSILKPGDSITVPVSLPVRDEFASVIFTKGQVTKNGVALETNDEVRRNDVVETGKSGYASLEFLTGTLINLQPNTVARIVTLYCRSDDETCVIEMAADRGTLSTDVKRDGDQPTDFRVQTPYASAAVRGTIFDINADSTGLRIGVTEGAVSLSAANSDQEVDLDLGFGSIAVPGSRLSAPIDLLPAPVYRFVPPRITKADVVRWFGLTDVEQYTVQIASSPNGVGIIHDTVVPSDLFRFSEDLPPGDFHMLLRPVDTNGLLGFTATTPITIAEIDPNIGTATASVERQNGNYRIEIVQAPEEANGYEVQISSDFNFTDPVSVDIDANGVALVRAEGENLYARARALLSRTLVGPYGEPSTVND